MFTLFKPTKTFPEIKNINLKVIQMYMVKFEESLKNLDEFHKESLKSNWQWYHRKVVTASKLELRCFFYLWYYWRLSSCPFIKSLIQSHSYHIRANVVSRAQPYFSMRKRRILPADLNYDESGIRVKIAFPQGHFLACPILLLKYQP